MAKLLLIAIIICFPQCLFSQEDDSEVYVYGRIVDAFTWEMLKGVQIEIRDEQDSLLGTKTTKGVFRISGEEVNFFQTLTRGKKYIFHCSHDDYEPLSLDFSQKVGRRQKYVSLGDVGLKKRNTTDRKYLDEMVVTASKVRMVVKGDTIEYSAADFQMAEGSMLDGLLKMLPGFEIENGQIRVDGQYVSSLLVNGNDFFKGDPRIALENLPAYMVNKVKVYRREHDWGYIAPTRQKEELPLVVDVNLKREYSVGWISNAEIGYGTAERYMARLFGMRFTDHSQLAIYGNANNTNDTREPGISGNWISQDMAPMRTTLQTAGMEAQIENKEKTWKYSGNAKFHHRRTNKESYSSSELFLPMELNTFSRISRQENQRNLHIETVHQLDMKRRLAFSTGAISGVYQRRHGRSDIMRGEFAENPFDEYRGASLDSLFLLSGSDRLSAILINKSRQQQRGEGDEWKGTASFSSHIKMLHSSDYISIKADINAGHINNSSFLEYKLFYHGASSPDDLRNQYDKMPQSKVNANLSFSYNYRDKWGDIALYTKVNERYTNTDYRLYCLDQFDTEQLTFGMLPSTFARLMESLDSRNSYTARQNNLNVAVGTPVTLYLIKKKANIEFRPEIQWRSDHLVYRRDILNTSPTRNIVCFTPGISYGFDNFRVSYNVSYTDPDLISQQGYINDADPLNIYKGNPSLRRSTHHSIKLLRNYYKKKWASNARINAYVNIIQRAIAHGMDYDYQTGVRIHSPRNVNGNWATGLSFNYTNPVDKKKQTILTSQTSIDYLNSVDYVLERSVVRNLNLREQIGGNIKWKQNIMTAKIGIRYLNATSPRANFQKINSFDLTYALTSQHSLPLGVTFATDLTLYQRMGYNDDTMNEVRFVMNARLSKSFIKERLSLTLDAFDIFHGLSNVTKIINAQGFSETWNNSLPSYAMLKIAYKLNKQPKKK